MTRRLARAALRAYPLGFRRRYGPELEALLAETPVTARVLADLVHDALVAHVRAAGPDADVGLEDRLRASASGLLGCWVAVAAAVCAYAKSTEDAPFAAAAHAHPALGAAHAAIAALAGVACAAVVIGAAPLVLVALRVARREPRLRRLLSRAAAAAGLFALLTALLVALAHAEPGAPSSSGRWPAWPAPPSACSPPARRCSPCRSPAAGSSPRWRGGRWWPRRWRRWRPPPRSTRSPWPSTPRPWPGRQTVR
jgi:hypothetical protein